MNRKAIEEKARRIAAGTFSDGTMRTMLYERIVQAFAPTPEKPPGYYDAVGGSAAEGK